MSSPVVVVGMDMGVAVLPCVLDTDVVISVLILVVADVFVPFRVAAIVVATILMDFVNMVEAGRAGRGWFVAAAMTVGKDRHGHS